MTCGLSCGPQLPCFVYGGSKGSGETARNSPKPSLAAKHTIKTKSHVQAHLVFSLVIHTRYNNDILITF